MAINKSQLKIPSSLLLVGAMMIANFINFLFNALLGRTLTFEEFGQLTLFTTLWAIMGVFVNALGGTINHKVSYLFSFSKKKAIGFYRSTVLKTTIAGSLLILLWIIASPVIARFFNIGDITKVMLFAPTILFGLLLTSGRGFLQGSLNFGSVAVLALIEPSARLIIAILLASSGLSEWAFLAIPLSILITLAVYTVKLRKDKGEIINNKNEERIPRAFFVASVLTGFSTYAFATFDVLLAKHFLSETTAGEYAVLSLVGKMVFFFGSVFNGFVLTYVSREAGLKKKSQSIFRVFFVAGVFMTLSSFVALGPLGHVFVPFLLGSKTASILPFLTNYTLGAALFTVANTLIGYHLAKKQYIFSFISVSMAVSLVVGILMKHSSIADITDVFLIVSFATFLVTCILHFIFDQGKFVLRNTIDLINLFSPLPQNKPKDDDSKRILIFNWRDTKHVYAGGAETYVHEIAKRWVSDGHHVTLFSGNDSKSKDYEMVDGVEVIRRGGFHTVYMWAFFYYLLQFRGRYDVVIDCQNGIPFLTPLYVREPVFAVIYHVHQNVFNQFLGFIPALIAKTIEKHVMPWVYKHASFITISESTKNDMQELGIPAERIQIVYCGVDLSNLYPGKKSRIPLVLYLGRLKAYKSVDVLVNAFKQVVDKFPNAQLSIAGTGDEEDNLHKLVKELGLEDNVVFHGKVTEEQKTELMQKAWVFVNPSMMEGWGITTIEANACGTPVVASDVPGLRDSVNNPHTGYLVEYGNVNAFAKQINKLLTDRIALRKMKHESIKWSKKFTWDKSAVKFRKLL